MTNNLPPIKKEVLFEIIRIGTIHRVTAIDPQTGTEAIIQAPTSLSIHDAKALAAKKLIYILSKSKN